MHCTFCNVIRLFYVLNVCFENEFVLSRSISLRFLKEVSYNHSMKSIFVYLFYFICFRIFSGFSRNALFNGLY